MDFIQEYEAKLERQKKFDRLDRLEEELVELEESIDGLAGVSDCWNKKSLKKAETRIKKLEKLIEEEKAKL